MPQSASSPVLPRDFALAALLSQETPGCPTWMLNLMEHRWLERLAGAQPGAYTQQPEAVYLAAQRAAGVSMIDQWIPTNPLTMGAAGYGHSAQSATQGIERIELDGIVIDSPEAVAEHLERFVFPKLRRRLAEFDPQAHIDQLLGKHAQVQELFGDDILKVPYGEVQFPKLHYSGYGYEAYFTAYAVYPELIEQHFALQADVAVLVNQAVAQAYRQGHLPPVSRLDHDMADSRGTLVDVRSLDRLWFPHFCRSIAPLLAAGVRLIWHCDGNLMQMVPRLLEAGLSGFQGFQYEDGMDYPAICQMKTRTGDDLLIIAGVSVTRTLPLGSPADVRAELRWLVEHGPKRGLLLGCSSSVTPGVPWDNLATLVAGLRHYATRRDG